MGFRFRRSTRLGPLRCHYRCAGLPLEQGRAWSGREINIQCSCQRHRNFKTALEGPIASGSLSFR